MRKSATSDFKFAGDKIYLVGESKQELGASELAFMMTEEGQTAGVGGHVPLLPHPEKNLSTYRALSQCIREGLVRTAHDCSEGGLAVSLAEMCIGGRIGVMLTLMEPVTLCGVECGVNRLAVLSSPYLPNTNQTFSLQ